MKIKRVVGGMLGELTIELTSDELRKAYEEQQHIYDVCDIEDELECAASDYEEEFGIDKAPVTEEEMGRMGYELRKILLQDSDACWSRARAEAVAKVLRERSGKET